MMGRVHAFHWMRSTTLDNLRLSELWVHSEAPAGAYHGSWAFASAPARLHLPVGEMVRCLAETR